MNDSSRSRPNILIFCVDQMQSYCLGCNGHPMLRTPNIDALAAEGVTFTRGYCPNPVCSPSRASMLTGLTPRQHGLLTNGSSLPESVPTLPQLLAESGYRTHAVGKLHLQPIGGLANLPPGASLEQRSDWDAGRTTDLPTPYYGFQSVDFVGGHVSFVFGHYRQWLDALDRQENCGVAAVGPTAAQEDAVK